MASLKHTSLQRAVARRRHHVDKAIAGVKAAFESLDVPVPLIDSDVDCCRAIRCDDALVRHNVLRFSVIHVRDLVLAE
jgi:hypothetical protein